MICNQEYVRETINMTGEEYALCAFHECVLIDNGTPASSSRSGSDAGGNAFRFCEFIGEGWPESVKRTKTWRRR